MDSSVNTANCLGYFCEIKCNLHVIVSDLIRWKLTTGLGFNLISLAGGWFSIGIPDESIDEEAINYSNLAICLVLLFRPFEDSCRSIFGIDSESIPREHQQHLVIHRRFGKAINIKPGRRKRRRCYGWLGTLSPSKKQADKSRLLVLGAPLRCSVEEI